MKNMDYKKKIKVNDDYEVIVAGGGPAGCAAATAAASSGAKTLLIEATGCLGGMGTSGLVPTWCPFSDGENVIYKGIAEEVLMKSKQYVPHVPKNMVDWVAIDPEQLKIIYDDLVTEAGADVIFNTFISDVVMGNNGVVDYVIVSNKSGISAYKAKTIIDCTGDADIAVWAGASYVKGDEKDGVLQPGTLCFLMSNVDEYAFRNGPWLNGANPQSPVHDMIRSENYPTIGDSHMCCTLIGPGVVGFNAMHVYVDGTDPITVSRGLVAGRKLSQEVRRGLSQFHPKAFANAFVSTTAPLLGIRETRIIEGEYTLTLEDYAKRRSFDDEICRNAYFIDVHSGISDEEYIKSIHYKKGESHGISYKCLVPKNVSNVIVAGRSVSCERMVQGSVRVMPVCLAMGEAAGYAAVIAIEDNVSFKEVDTGRLRKMLLDNGAYIK